MSYSASERSKVLWVGASPRPEDHAEHANRGLTLCEVDPSRLHEDLGDFAYARGVVICAMPPKVPAVKQSFGSIVRALDHGLFVVVLAADSLVHAFVQKHIEMVVPEGPARDLIRYRVGAAPHEVAELFARHQAGPAINLSLRIDAPAAVRLTDTQTFMLKRAFSDCSAIALTHLAGGRSALALSVQATLANSLAGPRPLPFFAKLDVSRKIVAERVCYERYAETHIAWNLRPNLQPARCLVGAQSGILVGSFVPKSESLWTLITQGRAEAAIKSLFTETLASWRDPEAATQAETGSIAPSLGGVFNYLNVRKSYLEGAADLGFAREPQEVWEGFLNLPSRSWPRAPIHGDLHAENVRIRANDAILIDLAKATMGPPGADPACMEVWIAFETPPPCAQIERTVWLQTVRELFGWHQVMSPPRPDPGVPNAWLRDAVIHTRRTALGSTPPVDYAITLALYLLRRASFPPDAVDTEDDAYRRTWAWILGCQLLEAVQDIECKYEEAA